MEAQNIFMYCDIDENRHPPIEKKTVGLKNRKQGPYSVGEQTAGYRAHRTLHQNTRKKRLRSLKLRVQQRKRDICAHRNPPLISLIGIQLNTENAHRPLAERGSQTEWVLAKQRWKCQFKGGYSSRARPSVRLSLFLPRKRYLTETNTLSLKKFFSISLINCSFLRKTCFISPFSSPKKHGISKISIAVRLVVPLLRSGKCVNYFSFKLLLNFPFFTK